MMAAPWAPRPLGQLVDVLDHRRVPVSAKERATRSGNVPYYGASGQVGWIDKPLFDEALLLLGEDGIQFFDPAESKAYAIDGPAWVNNHAHVLRARVDLVERRFLMYYLNWVDYRGFADGTTRLKLTKSAMTSIPIPLAPLPEQRRIVEILEDHLSRLDATRRGLEVARRRLGQTRISALMAALAAADHSGRRRGISFGASHLAIPEAWDASTVGAMSEVVEYGSGAKAEPGVGRVPVLRMGNVKGGALAWDSLKYLPESHPDVTRLPLHSGDLVFNRTNSAEHVGKSAVFLGERHATFASYLIRVRFRAAVNPLWASRVINSPLGRQFVAQQVGQANVNGSKLRAFPLPVPPRDEQDAMVARLDELDDAALCLEAQLDDATIRSATLRRSLLAAAFSGRLT